MEVVNEKTKPSRVEKIRIQYDMVPKYCKQCKLQGHAESDCRVLHPKLRKTMYEEVQGKKGKNDENAHPVTRVGKKYKKWQPTNKMPPIHKENEQQAREEGKVDRMGDACRKEPHEYDDEVLKNQDEMKDTSTT
ncbi:hypothetical protein H5410_002015 [Solanum commersonii]|uniref:Uncharacterized protein n=1 Tax=Solanum commersonii TaxID=4109 RepID=A0A9J6B161_SOLCO|nr:hypothetical protein H5410_002015 [Solanum commersonii]